jgi:translation elongation factor EF-1beta
VKNPLNVIIEALKNLKLKMDDIEADIDNIYQRLNMLQGVQSMPERRIKFR